MLTNYPACDLADYIASYTEKHNIICSGLDLQIVFYYCQANALVNYNTILFSEPIIPTSFGVVIESVWNEYKFCMGTNIFPMQQPKYLDQTIRLIIDQMVLLKRLGIKLEVINQTDNKDNELMDDFISLVTSFCNRIYGRRRKDKTNQIIKDLQDEIKEKHDHK